MTFKRVFTWSKQEKVLRLFRVMWLRHGGPTQNPNKGYSAKFSMALTPKIFRFARGWQEWYLVLLGIRMHYQRSYGGHHV